MKCRHMEDLVAKLKRQFIERVSNPANKTMKKREPLDLEALMAQRIDDMI